MRNLEIWAVCSLSVVLAACRFDLPAESPQDASPPADVPADPLELEFLAGDIGGPGNLDGTGATASGSGVSKISTPAGASR